MAGNRAAVALRVVIAGAVMLVAVGCGGAASKGGGTGGGSGGAAAGDLAAAGVYGVAPVPDPHITLQPDVVMIKDGPKAIHGVSADGLTWTMDGSAAGVKGLKPGDVMMASTFATGRVTQVEPQGGDVAVKLAPVDLTDIVKDGEIKTDEPGTGDPSSPGHLTIDRAEARIGAIGRPHHPRPAPRTWRPCRPGPDTGTVEQSA